MALTHGLSLALFALLAVSASAVRVTPRSLQAGCVDMADTCPAMLAANPNFCSAGNKFLGLDALFVCKATCKSCGAAANPPPPPAASAKPPPPSVSPPPPPADKANPPPPSVSPPPPPAKSTAPPPPSVSPPPPPAKSTAPPPPSVSPPPPPAKSTAPPPPSVSPPPPPAKANTPPPPPASGACADYPGRICNDWKKLGYCQAGYVSNGKSIRDELCPVTCGGACTAGTASPPPPPASSSCADYPGRICNDWKKLGYCQAGYVSNGKSIRDELCPVTCGGACASGK